MSEDKIWYQLTEEKPRQYSYFQKYINLPQVSIAEFHETLRTSSENNQKNTTPPTYKTLQTWATNNNWIKRKEAYQKYVLEETTRTLEEESIKDRLADVNAEKPLKEKLRKILSESFDQVAIPINSKDAFALKATMESYAIIKEELRFSYGQPTEITESSINADVNSTIATSDTDLMNQVKKLTETLDEDSENGSE